MSQVVDLRSINDKFIVDHTVACELSLGPINIKLRHHTESPLILQFDTYYTEFLHYSDLKNRQATRLNCALM